MSYSTDLFDQMVADVITLTARPDLESETALAVRTATNNCHFCDAFPRDMQSMAVNLLTPAYTAQLDLPTLFPRLRGISAVTILGSDGLPVLFKPGSGMEVIELGDVYDEYGAMRNNVAYLAGDKLNLRTVVPAYGFLVEWFKAPATRREDYLSWIAQLYPDAILYWAASIVLSTNGNEEKAAKYMQMTQQVHLPYMKSNFLIGAMR
jgi:hypothetical protein